MDIFIELFIHGYIYSRPLPHLPPKGNSKFEILLVKTFSLKQKANEILLATIEGIRFCLLEKTDYGSFRQGITISKCKTKAIQADLGILRTLGYSELWYIQNSRHIQNPVSHLRWSVLQKC